MKKTPMVRTYIQLPQQTYYQLRTMAVNESLPFTAVTRRVLQKGLTVDQNKMTAGNALMELVKLGETLKANGPKDLAKNHDKFTWDE